MNHSAAHGIFTVWRVLILTQLRDQPARATITLVAIALGVALGVAVFLVNSAALNEFGLATKRLVGEADVVVRGPREGFDERLFANLARDSAVDVASPVLELEAALPGRRETLKILALDPFRAAALQPAIIGDIGNGVIELFRRDSIYLSARAAQALNLKRDDRFDVIVGSIPMSLRVIGILAESTYPQALGVMDIASAQWSFAQLGRVNRVDLRLMAGTPVDLYRKELAREFPAGVVAVAPRVERDRAVTVTRAYRVNLNMLALVALWTGAFLVFSTQSLSVLRRRRALALLRALGVTRGQLQCALLAEGAALGAAGSLLGVALGLSLATLLLRLLTGDLGNGQLHAVSGVLQAATLPLLGFFLIGTLVSGGGAWLPARSAARQPPAQALKGGDAGSRVVTRSSWPLGCVLLGAGALLANLPPLGGLPVFGYAAVAALLFGAVLLVPSITVGALKIAPRTDRAVWDAAIAQLRDNVGLSTLTLASIIVSFSLMVAMAIMVYSFRVSFDHWLGKMLPADLQLRVPLGNDTAYWSPDIQAKLSTVKSISRIRFQRTRQILLDAEHPPVALIAHDFNSARAEDEIPIVRSAPISSATSPPPAWISEALQDLYGYRLGGIIHLPLSGKLHAFRVAGIWRDYARSAGAVIISRQAYIAATDDRTATEAAAWLETGSDPGEAEAALRACFARGDSLEIMTNTALRMRALQIFDRAFVITYALEAIAVIIGLTGVSFAASSTALARRAEFGMLRHIGMLRGQVIGMLGAEGFLLSVFGVFYGLALGSALSLVLVYVINRQSFNWSIDLAVPWWQLGVLSGTLIAAASLTAVWSGRAATSQDAVRAVREDW